MSDELSSTFDIENSGGSISEFFNKNFFWSQKEGDDDGNKKEGSDEDEGDALNRLTHSSEPKLSDEKEGGLFSLMGTFKGFLDKSNEGEKESTALNLLDMARDLSSQSSDSLKESSSNNDMDAFWKLLQECKNQWSTVAEESKVKEISPLAFMYFVGFEEARKTPSYRRRQHRFYPSLKADTLHDLHGALYLATISYMHTVEEIKEALADFKGDPWVMVYCDVASQPHQPAHFICLKRDQGKVEEKAFRFPWDAERVLDVLMVVRGTKEISDVFSDALIECTDYEDGKAHGGIQESGCYLVKKHTELLKKLLKESKREKVRISIVGHSLGAGAGAIAAMEFNKLGDWIEAKAVGFGCPALLSKELSESTKDYITTVINDSDCVPRMSGATLSNVVMRVMSTKYKDMAMADLDQVFEAIEINFPFKPSEDQKKSIVEYVEKSLDDDYEKKRVAYEPVDVVLFPPGKCIHLYRDGTGVSGSYVPCDFFNELDVSRTMIMDHLNGEGYDRIFHELMRTHLKDNRFQFPHNVEKIANKS